MTTFTQLLAWQQRHMPRTQRALQNLPPLDDMRLACSMHLDEKVVPALLGVRARGAELFVTTCNPTTVRGPVVDYLRQQGVSVSARPAMTTAEYEAAIQQALAWAPTHLCEMGADLSHAAHTDAAAPDTIRAALEATGSGINRLTALPLRYPIYNWDDLPLKEGLHNRHMVGLTTWHTFFTTTRLTLHEKQVVVIGYGSVGRGMARVARAYGGQVTVVEKDPSRALEARYDGWPVRALGDVVATADVIATATGAAGVLNDAHWPRLRAGVFLLNVGHRADEIDRPSLQQFPRKEMLPHVIRYTGPAGPIYLLADGAMFNLTAGAGDSLNAFDLTLALMIAGIGYLARPAAVQAPPGVHLLPRTVWEAVAPA